MNSDVTEALSTWPSGRPWWTDDVVDVGLSLVHWIYQLDMREKEALTPFNRVVFVHPASRRPMKLTRRKAVRSRKVWNKRRRDTRLQVSRRRRNSTLAQVNSPA